MQVPAQEKHNKAVDVEALTQALADPFEPTEVKFKPAVVSGNRAMALAYVDARVIQDRLDEALGPMNWQDDYECLPDGSVVCRLRLRLGDEWITKVDVGGPSEQQDGGDRLKAAFSDALKRAAVKFGVGRYLYRLPAQWVDYDPQRKQFVRPPTVPAFALPKKDRARAKENGLPAVAGKTEPAAKKGRAAKSGTHALPANGKELKERLEGYDAKLASQGLCERGALVKHILQAGQKAGHDKELSSWAGAAIQLAVEETKAFEARARQRQGQGRKEVA
ncbi:MAG: Rad52/Rad22 family DNA repair protein [Gemmataceae bacterium]|nr:Rad52/Rad22 family DNA repair protein [Gemmataceae bacterium]